MPRRRSPARQAKPPVEAPPAPDVSIPTDAPAPAWTVAPGEAVPEDRIEAGRAVLTDEPLRERARARWGELPGLYTVHET